MLRLIRYAYAGGYSVVAVVSCAAVAACLAMLLALQIGNVVGAAPQVAEAQSGGSAGTFFAQAAVLVAVFALDSVQPTLLHLATRRTVLNLECRTSDRILQPLLGPPRISHLEDSSVQDYVQRARGIGSFGIRTGIEAIGPRIRSRLTALGAAVIIGWTFSVWVASALLATTWFLEWYTARLLIAESDQLTDQTEGKRRCGYIFDLAMDRGAKEIRIFGLADWFRDRHLWLWSEAMAPLYRERMRAAVATLAVYGVHLGMMIAAVVLVTRAIEQGSLGLAELTTVVVAIVQLGMSADPAAACGVRRGLEAYEAMLEIPRMVSRKIVHGLEVAPQDSPDAQASDSLVRFTNVTFKYPGSENKVLNGLDLDIRPGERLALVGVNGVGKTTLVKLLHGLYLPESGRITLGGHDLSEMNDDALVSWQRGIVPVPQEFARLPLSVVENVAFNSCELGTHELETLRGALAKAGAGSFVERLSRGGNTLLDKAFEGGADLSGGEWQRLALARALYAHSSGVRLLVLDEPAAALDVRAEADLVDRYLELTSGVTSLTISHRFSVVRGADRICVMESGRIVESGAHTELMTNDGTYARMFRLQSDRYLEGAQ
ncbi:ABC transporter ATP-binding protein [Actinopolymorpha sp. B17G11]|uniref:ABC transporter ATP-binding protein n=1 Tax=Actinopolymorpha sp. B17G11 TaxID=3160861 RepID=UPI0032E4AE8A